MQSLVVLVVDRRCSSAMPSNSVGSSISATPSSSTAPAPSSSIYLEAPTHTNVLTDGDFEIDGRHEWEISWYDRDLVYIFGDTRNSCTGYKYASVAFTLPSLTGASFRHPVHLMPSKRYKFSTSAMASTSGIPCDFTYYIANESYGIFESIANGNWRVASSSMTWTTTTGFYDVPAGTTFFYLVTQVTCSRGGLWTFCFDDISLIEE